MKLYTLILALPLLLTVSCGKKNYTTVVENPYDDSQVKSKQVIQEARISALEARINALESRFNEVLIDYNSLVNNVDAQFSTLEETLTNNTLVVNTMLSDLAAKQTIPVKICASSEYLLKTSTGVYAVYMVSNNYGTYLGKLVEQTNYLTTDTVRATFKIVNNNIVCL